MDTALLRDAGLTEGETRVYFALLELGSSTTGPIIERSGVARSFIYKVISGLIAKGLVSFVTKEKTRHYQAADPSRILDYIDARQKLLEENRVKIQKLIPELTKRKVDAGADVRVFEGFNGLVTAHEHTYVALRKGDEYFYLGIAQEQPAHFHAYWNRDHKRRVKAGIQCRLLFHQDTPRAVLANRNKYKGCDARYMSDKVNTPAWFMGYKDFAVISFPSSKPITIQIKSREIADSFKAYFEEFWRRSKKFT